MIDPHGWQGGLVCAGLLYAALIGALIWWEKHW